MNTTSEIFLKGVSVQTIVTCMNAILQIVVFSIFSRILTREDFGLYAIIYGVVAILSSISEAGIGSALIQSKNVTKDFLSTAFSLCLFLGVCITVFSLVISGYIGDFIGNKNVIVPIRVLSIIILLYSLQSYAIAYFRKQLNFKKVGVCKLTSYLISSIVGVLLAYNGFGVYSLVYMYFVDSIIYTVLLYKDIKIPTILIDFKEARQILSFGGYLTLGVVITAISNQLDKLVLAKAMDVKEIGEYNRPAGFFGNIVSIVNTIFDTVLFPILSNYQDSKEYFKVLLERSVSLLSMLGLIFTTIIFFNSPLVIMIFFGSEWLDLVPIMRIISLSAIFLMLNTLADCFFRSFNLVKVGFVLRLVGLVLSVSILCFGAMFGIIGVAISVCISNAILSIMKIVYLCNKSGESILKIVRCICKCVLPILGFVIIGICFIFFEQNITNYILQVVVFSGLIIFEFCFCPSILGQEYVNMIYPKVKIIKNKIFRR